MSLLLSIRHDLTACCVYEANFHSWGGQIACRVGDLEILDDEFRVEVGVAASCSEVAMR
jgi:hypothetical protein